MMEKAITVFYEETSLLVYESVAKKIGLEHNQIIYNQGSFIAIMRLNKQHSDLKGLVNSVTKSN